MVKAKKLSATKIQMPTAARFGLSLLLVGAIFVGIGSYTHKGGFTLYGLPIAILGFLLYMFSSIITARKKKNKTTKQ